MNYSVSIVNRETVVDYLVVAAIVFLSIPVLRHYVEILERGK